MLREKKDDLAKRFQALADELKPDDLPTRIASYVLPERWSTLDVAEVEFDDEKRYAKAEAQVEKVCREIGVELASNDHALAKHLPTLLRTKSSRVWSVFSEVARHRADWLGTCAPGWAPVTAEGLDAADGMDQFERVEPPQ